MLPSEIRRVARERALLEVEKQKKDFMSWGVMGDWDKPYLTLSKFRRHNNHSHSKIFAFQAITIQHDDYLTFLPTP
jgi:isoleucyl-tRNA synthetase